MSFITQSQVQHLGRRLSQILQSPSVAVIGGYHGINVGDLALGYAVLNTLKEKNISGGLQTIYNLEKWNWPFAEKAIIGGGAVGYNDLVEVIAKRYTEYPENVAFLGVDFNDQQYSELSANFLKNVRWISCRSKDQVVKIEKLTGRNDIHLHPDIAFSLSKKDHFPQQSDLSEKKLLMNIVPLYGRVQNDNIIPGGQYASERPALYNNWDTMQKGYKALIYATIDDYISQGYAVETLPFTPMDHVAAKILLKGLKVYHHPFCPDPYRVFKKIQTASAFFASRYHATIFGLKANVNIIPFAYAKKNEQLLNDLQIDASHFHTPDDFTNVDFTFKEIRPINYDLRQVKYLQSDANLAIKKCVDTLLNFR